MTTQLIPVFAGELSGAPVQLVDARLLHTFLEVADRFSDWIKRRIEEYGFTLNQDYLFASEISEAKTGRGGHNKIDYHLSIDMAKELGMIERNDKGRQIRRYFLEMERIAKTGGISPQKYTNLQEQLFHAQRQVIGLLEEKVSNLEIRVPRKHQPDEIAAALRCRQEGFSYRDIGELLGRSKESVNHMVRRAEGRSL